MTQIDHSDAPMTAPHRVNFGDLRRLTPISRAFGFERGQPVDRHYIEQFLAQHAADIHGRVLEIGDDHYMRHFGGDRVQQADVLDLPREDGQATIVADLQEADHIPGAAFDCIIFTRRCSTFLSWKRPLPACTASCARAACSWALSPSSARFAGSTWIAGATTGASPMPLFTAC
jgi:hypothetical protein